MLEVSGLSAGYDKLQLLHDVDLAVTAGQLLAVIGANGAGKTTLLPAVSGLIRPSGGRISLGGRDLTALPAEKVAAAGLAHVPENRLVFPSLSVADNLLLGGWTRVTAHGSPTELADDDRAQSAYLGGGYSTTCT